MNEDNYFYDFNEDVSDPSEYLPQQWLAREEPIADMQARYKREYEKLMFYNSYDRTLCEIENLPEIHKD